MWKLVDTELKVVQSAEPLGPARLGTSNYLVDKNLLHIAPPRLPPEAPPEPPPGIVPDIETDTPPDPQYDPDEDGPLMPPPGPDTPWQNPPPMSASQNHHKYKKLKLVVPAISKTELELSLVHQPLFQRGHPVEPT